MSLHLLNDAKESVGVSAKLHWVSWQGELKQTWSLESTVSNDSNTVVWQLDEAYDSSELKSGFFYVEAQVGNERITNTWFSSHELKTLPMERANIEVTIEANKVTLIADKPAFFVHLECDTAGRFDDSSITLLANQPVTVEFLGEDMATMAESLRVYHLMQ